MEEIEKNSKDNKNLFNLMKKQTSKKQTTVKIKEYAKELLTVRMGQGEEEEKNKERRK